MLSTGITIIFVLIVTLHVLSVLALIIRIVLTAFLARFYTMESAWLPVLIILILSRTFVMIVIQAVITALEALF